MKRKSPYLGAEWQAEARTAFWMRACSGLILPSGGPKTQDRRHPKGQAAALDLAVFVSLCILALSYFFIQSAQSSGSTIFVEENEDVNEAAVKAINALAQSSASGVEIKTLQTAALKDVDACLAEDIKKVMGYADLLIEALDDMEKAAKNGEMFSSDANPLVAYLKERISDVSSYIADSTDIVVDVDSILESAGPEKEVICTAVELLATAFPGYEEYGADCGQAIVDSFLDGILGNLTSAEAITETFESALDDAFSELDSMTAESQQELVEYMHQIRCMIEDLRDTANSFLSYLETGIDPKVSFLELWPVKANVEKLTIEKLLADAMTSDESFVFADDARSLAGDATLFFIRQEDLGQNLPELPRNGSNSDEVEGSTEYDEYVVMLPKTPLSSTGNASAEGPYNAFIFMPEVYLTPKRALAVRMSVYGSDTGGVKHNTQYFEDAQYILNYSAYADSSHYRTYDGAFVGGKVTENRVTITTTQRTEEGNSGEDIASTTLVKESRILRPMKALLNFTFENVSWPDDFYDFDVAHYCVERNSNYTINSSPSECDQYNESDALKSIILGIITSGRGSLMDAAKELITERLDELLKGYEYKFRVNGCCGVVMEINPDAEPAGRRATVMYYFPVEGYRAEMNLTVWRE